MSLFRGIENAKVTERLPFIQPGRYLLQLEVAKQINSRGKGVMAIAEFKVLESEGAGANPTGTSASQVIKMSLDAALGNIKNLVASLLNIPTAQVTEAAAEAVFGPENPSKGVKVRAEAFPTEKKDGDPYTRITYAAYQGETTSTAAPVNGATSTTAMKSKSVSSRT